MQSVHEYKLVGTIFCHFCNCPAALALQALVLLASGWQGLAGFRGPQQNSSELSESAYLQIFATKTSFCTIAGNRPFVVVKRLTHTQARSLKHPFRCLDMYFFFTKLLFYESSLKALRKLSKSSPKAGSTKAI